MPAAAYNNFISQINLLTYEEMTNAMFALVEAMKAKKTLSENQADAKDPFYSETNMNFLKEAVKSLNEGKGVEHELIEV